MSKTMLIDAAHPEETRVAIVDGRQVEEFDFETRARRQLRGNIYLAKVTRVEPSLQAAFVEYGGNRHGFLAFNEIHPDYYQIPVADREAIMAEAHDDEDEDDLGRESSDDDADPETALADEERLKRRLMRRYKIQDVIKRRQILLVQVVKDERGAKGAALTTWLSLAGRYCVLMPNTGKGGGISRKITNTSDRRRLKSAVASLEVPNGMGLIIRTAGAKRTKAEIKRDYQYLLRLWGTIRETTLSSHAPAMIYEEENLVRRAVRDMFDKDFDGVQVEGVEGFKEARDFMRVLMPSQAKKIHLYRGSRPLFAANGIEEVLAQVHQPVVPLKSGGYLVINQTEALVSIDVNSGRATKERNVEQTALKTNLEAAVEAARQLRLRDLAGLVVIDFIDMDEGKNNRAVEKVLKDALSGDRARIQMGRISPFGLMEISRQRRRLGVIEGATEVCPHCQGMGRIRSAESAALTALRGVDIEAGKNGAGVVILKVCTAVGLYILNHKRDYLQSLLEARGLSVIVQIDDSLAQGEYAVDRTETNEDFVAPPVEWPDLDDGFDASAFDDEEDEEDEDDFASDDEDDADGERGSDDEDASETTDRDDSGRGRGRRRRRRGGRRDEETPDTVSAEDAEDEEEDDNSRRRRRGRRGGRRSREDGDRDVYTWVRGRTPSLDDPYVWFDPLNPERPQPRAERKPADETDTTVPPVETEGEEMSGGRRRRRRRRGRSSDVAHDAKVENRATNEGMPADGSPETPMAVKVDGTDASSEDATAAAVAAEPQRRRVRRKASRNVTAEVDGADEASFATAEPSPDTAVESNEATVEGSPVTLDVTPAEAAELAEQDRPVAPAKPARKSRRKPKAAAAAEPEVTVTAEPEAEVEAEAAAPVIAEAEAEAVAEAEPAPAPAAEVVLTEAAPAPVAEVDIGAIIANDPNQISGAPPAKPKRGWWRR